VRRREVRAPSAAEERRVRPREDRAPSPAEERRVRPREDRAPSPPEERRVRPREERATMENTRGKMLRFLNPRGKICYANSGTNFLLSAPEVCQFLAHQPPGGPLNNILHRLLRTRPDQVSSRAM